MSELAKVIIKRPKGCTKTKLDTNSLDSMRRELAFGTQITVDGKPLLCLSFAAFVEGDGTLFLEVKPECWEFADE